MSKRIKCEIILDFDTKDYDIRFHKLYGFDGEIDFDLAIRLLMAAVIDTDKQVKQEGVNSTDQITKIIH